MRLLLMRHGIAADRETWTQSDALRPLTSQGETKTRRAVFGLKNIQSQIDILASSPLLRARQTAEVVQGEYSTEIQTWSELEHADFQPLMKRLKTLPRDSVVLCVGHEPGLSRFVAQCLTGSARGLELEWKKAGVCALEINDGRATLLYLLTPRQLRNLRVHQK
jgi:phosphohistidine phosphatase